MLATQTLSQPKPKSMRINYTGALAPFVTAKDLILGTIGQMGTNGAAGHAVEYAGEVIRGLHDGAADDRLQHDDRGRRARGHGRARRDDVRVGRRPPGRARGLRGGAGVLAHAAHRRGRDVRPRDHRRRGRALAAGHLGHEPRPGRRRRRRRARAALGDRRALAGLHGPRGRHADHRAQARPRVHRLLHERAHRRPARRGGDDQGPPRRLQRRRDGRPGLPAGRARRPSARASTRSSAPRASTGAPRAARCAWA